MSGGGRALWEERSVTCSGQFGNCTGGHLKGENILTCTEPGTCTLDFHADAEAGGCYSRATMTVIRHLGVRSPEVASEMFLGGP